MNPDRSGLTKLTDGPTDEMPSWYRNRRIVFSRVVDGQREIFSRNVDGSLVTRPTFNDGMDSDPEYSPDGQKIAFTSVRQGNKDIYVMNADGVVSGRSPHRVHLGSERQHGDRGDQRGRHGGDGHQQRLGVRWLPELEQIARRRGA